MKCLLPGRRTALIVCQAISIAMTVVLPAPVASFSASRSSSGLASSVGAGQMVEKSLAALGLGRDLGQPDRGFHRLDLAEERANAAELVMPPVLEQAGRFRRDLPLVGIRQGPPLIHALTQLVDDRGRVVLLFGVESPRPSSKTIFCWSADPLRFFGFGIGVMNSARLRVSIIFWVGWPVGIQLPVPSGHT